MLCIPATISFFIAYSGLVNKNAGVFWPSGLINSVSKTSKYGSVPGLCARIGVSTSWKSWTKKYSRIPCITCSRTKNFDHRCGCWRRRCQFFIAPLLFWMRFSFLNFLECVLDAVIKVNVLVRGQTQDRDQKISEFLLISLVSLSGFICGFPAVFRQVCTRNLADLFH